MTTGPAAARYAPGAELDGFTLGERIHSGAMGHIYQVTRASSPFPLIMKVPRVGPGETGEGIINFETEAMLLPALAGSHVPRFVARGNLSRTPYLVTEWIEGESLDRRLARGRLSASDTARIGAAVADAVHSLHLQDAIHLDLKPENVILKPSGDVVLIDFGIAYHAHFPDLLAEEQRFAAGSAPYISPEQVLGTRSDPRSDIFALGAMLYEMATGELPFGVPATQAGLRDRLWRDPIPPRARSAEIPPWLQEVILRCLEPTADARYQSAAHVAFDLRHPDQVPLTRRAARTAQSGFLEQSRRWWRGRHQPPAPRRLPKSQVAATPIIMVAVDTGHPDDERQPALQRATAELLSLSADFRLICVSVIARTVAAEGAMDGETASGIYLDHMARLRHWVEPLRLPPRRLSLHVIESANPESALLEFADNNHVDLIVLGAPHPSQLGLAWWRSVASRVTANASCSVHVVRVPERAGSSDE
ncbi:MAG TPA: bifunctional serine/threonine-protein kinase/universal stress protein [Casimicrobiaceae bacterium]|jgi:serine/threonine protein kinase|nr:bifunctional serine/threonine-protein kinase/universal stress protein [Casimicrobiaceae bacterium]